MTNSTDKTAAGRKPAKKQGPIRFEAVVPLLIVTGLIVLYFSLFFDTHLRRSIEYGAQLANGAEVNVGRLHTSVLQASVVLGDVEVTNPEQPERNRLQIGEMRFHMLWDALLRGKVAIDEAAIEDVQIDTPRKSPGRVLPVEPAKEGESATDNMLAQMKNEFSGNVVGDLAAVAAGANPAEQLKVVGSELKSSAYLDGLQKSLDETEQQWKTRLDALPSGKDFTALRGRLSGVQLKDFKDIGQVQASLKELQDIRNEFDAMSKPVGAAGSALTGDMGTLRGSFADLEKLAREDVRGLQSRMHLPSLDAATLSRALFGMDVLGKVQQARGYMDQARRYMPTKKEQQKPKVAPETRSKGRDYVFGTPKGYPSFWLRKALITSPATGGRGGISGEILDVSTNPPLTGRPMVATLRGNFPQRAISGVKAELVIDHTKNEPLESLKLEVGRYAVAGRSLVNSQSLALDIANAQAATSFSAALRGEKVDMRLGNRLSGVAFETRAQSAVVREMMAASLGGLSRVNMDAQVSGNWNDLNWKLSTNLADALASGMRRYLQGKMDEAKARIENLVNGQIGEQKKRLTARQAELESRLKSALAERQAQVDKLRSELDSARNELDKRKNAAVDTQKQKLKQEAGKLLEGFRK